MLTAWSDALGDIESFDTLEERQARPAIAYEMGAAFKELWDRKAPSPGEHDLISTMLQSDAMSHMTHEEFMGNLIPLIVGGNATTRHSMSPYPYGMPRSREAPANPEGNPDPQPAAHH